MTWNKNQINDWRNVTEADNSEAIRLQKKYLHEDSVKRGGTRVRKSSLVSVLLLMHGFREKIDFFIERIKLSKTKATMYTFIKSWQSPCCIPLHLIPFDSIPFYFIPRILFNSILSTLLHSFLFWFVFPPLLSLPLLSPSLPSPPLPSPCQSHVVTFSESVLHGMAFCFCNTRFIRKIKKDWACQRFMLI